MVDYSTKGYLMPATSRYESASHMVYMEFYAIKGTCERERQQST